ncbi:MAG: 5-formyltetrahydrofolate cyclo-ligase [Candidatus Contendobacter sp.]|nr:5-formyltetrahydrofolate cyclo-ligase [Candidatus Contendobacter sp.]MDG4556534.1 5-formyltetrahydrofolate cyclo-ligase [Candidatus Contendobacter sp.]
MNDDPPARRRRLRARRRALSPIERDRAALAVARRLEDWPAWDGAIRVAGYWACDGELDPAPLLERAWATHRQVYLPVLDGECSLRFAPYLPGTPLRRNRFHIPEPDVSPMEWLEPSRLDVVLLPLVAFDSAGTRLGMGGGWYDRAFAFLRDPACRSGHRPVLLGLGYEFQRVAALVRQAWDVPLDAAVTETALSVFSAVEGSALASKLSLQSVGKGSKRVPAAQRCPSRNIR